jgi:hypothetical protein
VVFLIGMRLNKPWKIWKWWPVFTAMRPMLRRLKQDPDLGLLHAQTGLLGRGPMLVCYFRSLEHLYRFATSQNEPHVGPWRQFNRKVRDSGDVGIWHETYLVRPEHTECVYGNMPPWGLAAATSLVPVARRGHSAARRAGLTTEDSPVVAPY